MSFIPKYPKTLKSAQQQEAKFASAHTHESTVCSGKKMANTMSINHEFQDIFKSAQQIEAKFVVFQHKLFNNFPQKV